MAFSKNKLPWKESTYFWSDLISTKFSSGLGPQGDGQTAFPAPLHLYISPATWCTSTLLLFQSQTTLLLTEKEQGPPSGAQYAWYSAPHYAILHVLEPVGAQASLLPSVPGGNCVCCPETFPQHGPSEDLSHILGIHFSIQISACTLLFQKCASIPLAYIIYTLLQLPVIFIVAFVSCS